MKLSDIFKKKEPPKEEPQPFTPFIPTTHIRKSDDEVIELPNDTILNDGTCLITKEGQYYHLHVGCYGKWSFPFTGWKMISVDDAKKQGLLFCLICNEEIRERRK